MYGGKPIPSTERDATYVLDEILDNETELPIDQHTTDTAGYSELVFSLFDLVGLQFSPRIRDMADQHLYRIDRSVRYQHIEPLFSGTLNEDLILRRWDDLLRVAGSVKMGWVTASLLIGKLQSYRRQNALIRALQEYGRLIKTIHIVRCLDSPEYRRSIGRQLNKGRTTPQSAPLPVLRQRRRDSPLSTRTRRRRYSASTSRLTPSLPGTPST